MRWAEIRKTYPQQWLVIEAIEAHTVSGNRRRFDCLTVVETCLDGKTAMERYRDLHRKFPRREFYFVHTSRSELNIIEHPWIGIRKNDGIAAAR